MLRLTHERERLGWPKARLARRARVDQGYLSRIEAGRAVPYPVELRRLARALRLPREAASRLLDEVEHSLQADEHPSRSTLSTSLTVPGSANASQAPGPRRRRAQPTTGSARDPQPQRA